MIKRILLGSETHLPLQLYFYFDLSQNTLKPPGRLSFKTGKRCISLVVSASFWKGLSDVAEQQFAHSQDLMFWPLQVSGLEGGQREDA